MSEEDKKPAEKDVAKRGEPRDKSGSAGASGSSGPGSADSTQTGTKRVRGGLIYLLLLVLILVTISSFFNQGGIEASYDEFLTHLRLGHVESVDTGNDYHVGVMTIPEGWSATPPTEPAARDVESQDSGGTSSAKTAKATRLDKLIAGGKLPNSGRFRFRVIAVRDGSHDLTQELEEAHRRFGTKFKERATSEFWTLFFFILGPFLLIAFFWFFLMRQSGQMGRTALSFGKVRAKLYADKQTGVNFGDVAGCDEAKDELKEVVDFLKSPQKYQDLGGKMPRGILLVGPPGTGKTLLARAVAGEAKTPFFHLSGSDFVEMFVGVGAARVRDLFQQAKSRAPSIIFVDELDAVGRHRGAGLGGGHDEREQTLNQLLVEMDGFDSTTGVILLAATNRPDVLDPALLRPGRFDRQVVIDAPDAKGRAAILEIHARDKPMADDINFAELASKTPGFTGADLANVLNEAALLAARADLKKVGQAQLDEAVERVIAGPERRSRRLSDEERKRVAYHEAGHALVAALSENADPVRKISIVPRGHAALGYTMQSPDGDRYLVTKSALLDQLKGLLGGRAAEKIVFGETSTGASDDLNRATQIARGMVCRFGMTEALGPVALGREQHQVFLGRDLSQEDRNYSERSAEAIDEEVRRLIDEADDTAAKLLSDHRPCLDRLAETLLEKEVLQGKELKAMLDTATCGEAEKTPRAEPPESQVTEASTPAAAE